MALPSGQAMCLLRSLTLQICMEMSMLVDLAGAGGGCSTWEWMNETLLGQSWDTGWQVSGWEGPHPS